MAKRQVARRLQDRSHLWCEHSSRLVISKDGQVRKQHTLKRDTLRGA